MISIKELFVLAVMTVIISCGHESNEAKSIDTSSGEASSGINETPYDENGNDETITGSDLEIGENSQKDNMEKYGLEGIWFAIEVYLNGEIYEPGNCSQEILISENGNAIWLNLCGDDEEMLMTWRKYSTDEGSEGITIHSKQRCDGRKEEQIRMLAYEAEKLVSTLVADDGSEIKYIFKKVEKRRPIGTNVRYGTWYDGSWVDSEMCRRIEQNS